LVDRGYNVPRYSFICFLYLKDEETKRSWEFYLPNYFEVFGLFGKVFNCLFAVFGLLIFLDMMYLRAFQLKGRVDYLTNMDTLRERNDYRNSVAMIEVVDQKEEIEFLGKQKKEKLLKGMRTKLLFLNKSILMLFCSTYMYHLLACPLFLYNRPHIMTIMNVVIMSFFCYFSDHFILNLFLSYVITVDYFSSRIKFMLRRLKEEIPVEDTITRVIIQYNKLMMDFKNQDYLLKYLLRNMMSAHILGLSFLFFMFTINMILILLPLQSFQSRCSRVVCLSDTFIP